MRVGNRISVGVGERCSSEWRQRVNGRNCILLNHSVCVVSVTRSCHRDTMIFREVLSPHCERSRILLRMYVRQV